MKKLIAACLMLAGAAVAQAINVPSVGNHIGGAYAPSTFVTSGVLLKDSRSAYFAAGRLMNDAQSKVPTYTTLQYVDHSLSVGVYSRIYSTKLLWLAASATTGANDAGSPSFKLNGVIGLRIFNTGISATWKPAGVVVHGSNGQMFGLLIAF